MAFKISWSIIKKIKCQACLAKILSKTASIHNSLKTGGKFNVLPPPPKKKSVATDSCTSYELSSTYRYSHKIQHARFDFSRVRWSSATTNGHVEVGDQDVRLYGRADVPPTTNQKTRNLHHTRWISTLNSCVRTLNTITVYLILDPSNCRVGFVVGATWRSPPPTLDQTFIFFCRRFGNEFFFRY